MTEALRLADEPEQPPVVIIHVDGLRVDADTGEIVGVADETFRVRDRKSAEWVLEKIGRHEAVVEMGERRIAFVTDNIRRETAPHARAASWLRAKFGPQLEQWARAELADRKERSIQTDYGRLGFRKTQGRIAVAKDALERAAAWCEVHAPLAVSMVPKVLVGPLKGREAELPPDLFEVTPAGENFSIDTGGDA